MTDVLDLSIRGLLDAYDKRKLSTPEVVQSYVNRIRAVGGSSPAVIRLCTESALRAAHESERRWSSGDPRPLEGVPFGLKDTFCTAGVETTFGSPMFASHIPARSAAVVERLTNAGGIMLAKLATYELGFGRDHGHGVLPNPWNHDHTAGGSSSGPAVAVATRQLPFALGSDTGGSIRNPAAYCGAVGFKPTYGHLPRTGVMPVSWSLDHVGPITRSADDARLVVALASGRDAGDPTSLHGGPDLKSEASARFMPDELVGARIGFSSWFSTICDEAVWESVKATLRRLVELGAETVEVEIPSLDSCDEMARTIMLAETAEIHRPLWDSIGELSPDIGQRVSRGRGVAATDYLAALRHRYRVQQEFAAAFADVDAMVAPTSPIQPPRLFDLMGKLNGEQIPSREVGSRATRVFNLTGLPAIAIPSGFSGGLPLSVQIIGPPRGDDMCLRVASALQAAAPYQCQLPPSLSPQQAGRGR